jgi:hypothetical protein
MEHIKSEQSTVNHCDHCDLHGQLWRFSIDLRLADEQPNLSGNFCSRECFLISHSREITDISQDAMRAALELRSLSSESRTLNAKRRRDGIEADRQQKRARRRYNQSRQELANTSNPTSSAPVASLASPDEQIASQMPQSRWGFSTPVEIKYCETCHCAPCECALTESEA